MKPVGTPSSEPVVTLPTAKLLASAAGVGLLAGLGWFAVTGLGGWASDVEMAGLVGGAVVGCTGALGVLVMRPWIARPVSWWITMWLAATVLRLFITPAATFLLYSAASLDGMALTLAVALAYLAALLAEAVVLACHVGAVTSRFGSNGVSHAPQAREGC